MSVRINRLLLGSYWLFFVPAALGLPLEPTPAPEGAKVVITKPANGEKVEAPFTVEYELTNVELADPGAVGNHLHLLIDSNMEVNANQPMGNEVRTLDPSQKQFQLFLTPGRHDLQIILSDELHRPHAPAVMSPMITIDVRSN